MKLYELEYGNKFTLVEIPQIPPDALEGHLEDVYTYFGVDGMYARVNGIQGRTYFAAWTEVNKL